MRAVRIAAALALLALPAAAQHGARHGGQQAAPGSGYAGQQAREIKALSAEDTADLLAGRGMGLARAAELNGHPGPMHVLELRERLALTPAQEQAARASFERMAAAARPLGAALVEEERALDRGFAEASLSADGIAARTAAIGALQGRLRAVHLAAHVEMRALLTPAQVAAYDAARGYSGPAAAAPHGHGTHAPPPR